VVCLKSQCLSIGYFSVLEAFNCPHDAWFHISFLRFLFGWNNCVFVLKIKKVSGIHFSDSRLWLAAWCRNLTTGFSSCKSWSRCHADRHFT
jgi:hypothetical protein